VSLNFTSFAIPPEQIATGASAVKIGETTFELTIYPVQVSQRNIFPSWELPEEIKSLSS
jgi:hypothetical protein